MRTLRPRSTGDLVAGLIFVVLGAAFAVGALGYELGDLLDMGPGYLPLALGLLLALLGVACVVKAYVAPDAPDTPAPDAADQPDPRPLAGLEWRPIAAISGAIVFFALTVDGLGVLPATFGAVLLAALARDGVSWRRTLVIAVGLTALCWVVFVLALQLRLPLFGDWLGG
ncbi:tripartite tricarboxylate transporter TctB family protein [Promicromonospora sp. NPDC050880]|uniref:tripartite tricarboxylate transporter TctB family protein n=1 Tax=Promicromonospora sp. NPDC050880 TaxID=3364406 RepID=UPI00379FAF8A